MQIRTIDLDKAVAPALTVMLAFGILAPVAFLVYGAATTVQIGQPFTGFTTSNFIAAVTEPVYVGAFLNTVYIGLTSTILSALLGVTFAWIIARTDTPWRSFLRVGIMAPFFISPFIGALAWTLLLQRDVGPLNIVFSVLGLGQISPYSAQMIIWVMGIYYAPYMFIFVSSALHNLDPSLEEAGHLSGLNRMQVATRITLPLVAPAILSGALLTFIASAGQFGVPALLGMQQRFYVLTTYMYQLLNRFPANYNMVAAMGLVMLAVACAGVWAQNLILRGKSYATLTGKGFQPRIIPLGRWRWAAFGLVALFIFVAAVLPMAILAWVSIVRYYDATFSLETLSSMHYSKLFLARSWRAIGNTLFLSTTAAVIAILLAVAANWILLRSQSILRKPLEYLLVVPAAIPHVVLGVGLLWTYIFIPLPIYGTIWILLIAYVTGFITQAVRNVGANYMQIDKSLEEAATMVGASRMRTAWEVTIPLLKSGMVGAGLLLFIVFVRELSTSIFLYSPGSEVLSVLLFTMWGEGDWGGIAALAMVQVLVMATVVFAAGVVFKVDVTRSQA